MTPLFSNPEQLLFYDAHAEVTVLEALRRSSLTADRLRSEGVQAGDLVGVSLPTGPDVFYALFAVWSLGAIPVLGHPKFPQAETRRRFDELETTAALFAVDVDDRREPVSVSVDLDAIAALMFTSGSTGTPKVVAHTFSSLLANAHGANERMPFEPGDRWLASLPMCHVGGLSLLFRASDGGGALQFFDGGLTDAVTRFSSSHFSFVPTQLMRVLTDPAAVAVLQNAEVILIGGAPLPERLGLAAIEARLPIRTTYGLTETGSQFATSEPGQFQTVGRPLPGRFLKIVDGIIHVGGDTLFAGYWVNGSPVRAVDADGFFKTSDLGRMVGDDLVIEGRCDNVFISGGENVSAEEIERLMIATFGFDEVVVVPVPDAIYGARPFAFVAPMTTVNLDELPVASFMKPIGVEPLNYDGLKPDRAALANEAARCLRR